MDFRKVVDSRDARERRYQRICALVDLKPSDRVLDVGCGSGSSFEDFNTRNEIVGLDIEPEPRIVQPNFRFVHGDAVQMDCFDDREFDVSVCVGVLERVAPYTSLRRAAAEIRRVASRHVVVVPHILTIVDPYSQMPFGQFSARNFRMFSRRWELMDAEPRDGCRNVDGEDLFYLRARDWSSLFPESSIVSYRHVGFGLLSDFIIYGGS